MLSRHEYFLFVVDTDTYAGSFERQLTAWCTGQVGECEVGDTEAAQFWQAYPGGETVFEDAMCQLPDEHGCHRPTTIYPTPGYWNDGVGNHWPDAAWGTAETVTAYQLKGAKLSRPLPQEETPRKRLAYQSVAMFFAQQPTPGTLLFLMQRARAFAETRERFRGLFTIIGFRLMRHEEHDPLVCGYPADYGQVDTP